MIRNRPGTLFARHGLALLVITASWPATVATAEEPPTRPGPALRSLPPTGDEAKYLSNITQLTFPEHGFVSAGEAYFSPNGRTVIFQAVPAGKTEYQIYTIELPAGKPKMVSTGRGACTCAFFRPDGKKIIFASSHLDPDADKERPKDKGGQYEWHFNAHMDVFEADPDGGSLKRLTDAPGYDAECAYSPDGRQIVFCSNRDGDLELYIMNADGAGQRRLTHAKGYDGGPFFSPDGRTILYRGDRRSDDKMNLQIRTIAPDGAGDRALTDNDVFNWCPFWHPNGRCFVFTRADHEAYAKGARPNYDLMMMTPDGGTTVRITHDDQFDGLPAFSPDGKKLMWTSKRGPIEDAQVFIADFTMPGELR